MPDKSQAPQNESDSSSDNSNTSFGKIRAHINNIEHPVDELAQRYCDEGAMPSTAYRNVAQSLYDTINPMPASKPEPSTPVAPLNENSGVKPINKDPMTDICRCGHNREDQAQEDYTLGRCGACNNCLKFVFSHSKGSPKDLAPVAASGPQDGDTEVSDADKG